MNKTRTYLVYASAVVFSILAGLAVGNFIGGRSGDAPKPTVRVGEHAAILAAADSRVVMYTLTTCPACTEAKRYLEARNIRYIEHPIDQPSPARDEARRLGAERTPFMLIGKYQVQGFDPSTIAELLRKEGIAPAAG